MPAHTVHKIGGTSMSAVDAALDNVLIAGRTGDALYNRVFVVSAYSGMTDRLLENKKTGEPGVYGLYAASNGDGPWSDGLSAVGEEMRRMNRVALDDPVDVKQADAFVEERIEGARVCLRDLHRLCGFGHFKLSEHLSTVQNLLSGLGEAHSAHNTALLLRRRGVEAVFVDLSGWREEAAPTLDERIEGAFRDIDLARRLPIVTGYAQCQAGLLTVYGRGYSEVTFSRIAVCTGAREAVIHKEFHLSSADPGLVGPEAVRPIMETNYDVADQLSNMGMEAIHPSAAKGLRQSGIPLRIMNTFEPEHPGALISSAHDAPEPGVEIVTGMKDVFAFEFFEQDMVGVKGYDAAILEALKRHRCSIVAKVSNANTITHFLQASPKRVKRVERDLAEQFPSAAITARRIALVAAIGRDLKVPGLAVRALSALEEAGIEPLGLNDPMRKVDLQVIVDNADHDRAIRILHKTLIEEAAGGPSLARAA